MSHWNGDEWRWRMRAPSSVPTIRVSDLSSDAAAERAEKIKRGADVVPFGFARALPRNPRRYVDPDEVGFTTSNDGGVW